jgi:hypothetical protein
MSLFGSWYQLLIHLLFGGLTLKKLKVNLDKNSLIVVKLNPENKPSKIKLNNQPHKILNNIFSIDSLL